MSTSSTWPDNGSDNDDTVTTRRPRPVPPRIRWDACGLSDPGKIRQVNEDAFFAGTSQALWVVADGMGGHAKGDVASGDIANAFALLDAPMTLSSLADLAESTLLGLNAKFLELADRDQEGSTVGSTVVILAARQGWMLYLWVGDSRLYRWRDGSLTQLSQDHSQVEELIDRGLLLRENAEAHPAANVVTRAIGATDVLHVDMDYCDLLAGDRYLLCSDGLTKEVPERQIRDILGRNADAATLCRALIDATLQARARDNVTVVVAKAEAD